MTTLQDRIYANIVDQIILKLKAERLNNELQAVERRNMTIVGRMSMLSEMYEETTGRNLEKDLNQDEKWGELIKRAQNEAQQKVAQQAIDGNQSEILSTMPGQRPIKAVAQNKQPMSRPQPTPIPPAPAPDSDADVAPSVARVVVGEGGNEEIPKPQQRTDVDNRDQPIKFTVDDEPPVAPAGTPVTELDESD